MNRSFTIEPLSFEPQHEPGDHFGAGYCVEWSCRLCTWAGRTTPTQDANRVQEDARNVALKHGYGLCVP